MSIFENLSEDRISKIADVMDQDYYAAGHYIIRQGEKVSPWNFGDVWKINFSGRHLLHHQFGSSEGHSTDRGWNGTQGDQDAQSGSLFYFYCYFENSPVFLCQNFWLTNWEIFESPLFFLNWIFTNAFRAISSGSVLCWVKRSERQTSSPWRLESKSSLWIG